MTPSDEIDAYIAGLTDWRGEVLARWRAIFHAVDPEVVEKWKWMGSPVWEHDGILAVGNAFKTTVKLGFMNGASLADPHGTFNDELGRKRARA